MIRPSRGIGYARYRDGCYAVKVGRKRGPIGHSKRTALKRFKKSGLIAPVSQHGPRPYGGIR